MPWRGTPAVLPANLGAKGGNLGGYWVKKKKRAILYQGTVGAAKRGGHEVGGDDGGWWELGTPKPAGAGDWGWGPPIIDSPGVSHSP